MLICVFTFTQVAGNFPEIADLLMPRPGPLELDNWENIQREDEKNFQKQQQKIKNENDRDNSNSANAKVQASGSAT